jgi:hypothetical protein
MFPVVVPSAFSIVAHRGASGYAPENTMASIKLLVDFRPFRPGRGDGCMVFCEEHRINHPRAAPNRPAGEQRQRSGYAASMMNCVRVDFIA